jgi:hypothetical protein
MRQPISKQDYLTVFKRDVWTCRYCGDAVFFTPVLKLLNELNPGHGYFHPNGKTGAVLDIFQWKWATVDHIIPVSHGGENILDNFVTACWKCNLTYRDIEIGKARPGLMSIVNRDMSWDGFSGLYTKISPRKDGWYKLLLAYEKENV